MYFIVCGSVDNLRLLIGPLPEILCNFNIISKNTLVLSGIGVNLSVILFKFFYICVWKSYREMNHSLLAAFIFRNSVLIGFYASFSQSYLDTKLNRGHQICLGTYEENHEIFGPKPIEFLAILGCLLYAILMIPILLTKHQIYTNFNINQVPKSLESLCLNFVINLILISGVVSNILMNR